MASERAVSSTAMVIGKNHWGGEDEKHQLASCCARPAIKWPSNVKCDNRLLRLSLPFLVVHVCKLLPKLLFSAMFKTSDKVSSC